jgi:hypothetical protein
MGEARWNWRRHPLVLGPLAGWLAGMAWWAALVVAFGTHDGEGSITIASRLVYAPLVAIPWAVVGLVVGALTWAIGGPWVPVPAGLGAVTVGALTLATGPLDGWLVVTMPVGCLGAALAGCVVGAVAYALWRSVE